MMLMFYGNLKTQINTMRIFTNLNKLIIVCLILHFSINIKSQIDIGLFNNKSVKEVFLEVNSGKYIVKSGKKRLYKLKNERSLIFNNTKNGISVSNVNKDFGLHKSIKIIGKKKGLFKKSSKTNVLNVKLISPKYKSRLYDNDLIINSKNNKLQLINRVELQNYLAGVVEAESGSKAEFEYYKNQAVICRTYAIKSKDKHKKDGFNLCDGVHCQAYKGKSIHNENIVKAVKKTKDLVIVDKKGKLITSVFSANCGGQTNNSEDVWLNKVSYLRSINDKFCTDQRQATWTKEISVSDWKNFLKTKNFVINDTIISDSLAFKQENRRKFYEFNNQKIKLTKIRYGLKLRSTFFSIKPDGEKLILKGRGYGHGVGMCQEGAMNMAKKGYKFDEIIKYYYTDVKIKQIKNDY